MAKNPIQNLIDSGLQFTEMQRKEAEKVVKKLVKSGEVRRAEAEKTVQSLIERGKETTSVIAAVVKADQLALERLVRRAGVGLAEPDARGSVLADHPAPQRIVAVEDQDLAGAAEQRAHEGRVVAAELDERAPAE